MSKDNGGQTLGKVCTSISARTCKAMAKKASLAFSLGSDLVELRIDHLADPDAEEILESLRLVLPRSALTVRPLGEGGSFAGTEEDRIGLMEVLASKSPAYLDIELETARRHPRFARSIASELIVSWHDLDGTPDDRVLKGKARAALRLGRMAKVVTTASCLEDNLRVLDLYGSARAGGLVAFCMGPKGLVSRIGSMTLSPLIYCSLPGEPVGAGQLPVPMVRELLGAMRA